MKKRYEVLHTIIDTPENRALKLEALMESYAYCVSDKCKDCAFVGFGRAIRVCNIKFCPMCGRRLGEDG